MPELPEVETVRRTLEALVVGKKIERVTVMLPKMIKLPQESAQFREALIGQEIKGIGRRGKFLIFRTTDFSLVSHLRMEGRYGLFNSDEPVAKHTHVIFHFDDGTELRYSDVRKFGTMHLFKKGDEHKEQPLADLGPEPFSDGFTVKDLKIRLAKTRRNIKTTLLDQRVVAGLGNIYVDETLFKAKIHPERAADSLTDEEINVLHQKIIETLAEAVEKGGSTVRSYVNSLGQIGMFQLELFVYGRRGEDCRLCKTPLERIVVGGRGTVFCPVCQKKE